MPQATGKRRKKDSDSVENFSFNYRAPEWTHSHLAEFSRVAKAHAAQNPSDPFAYGRAFTHLKRGIADASELLK